MRNISFFLTKRQFLDGTKDVTRRLGWKNVKPGDRLMAVEKGQGIKKGGLKRLGEIEVVKVDREMLGAIDTLDCQREGFPEMTPVQFINMFCDHMGCAPDTWVTRIEFRRVVRELAPKWTLVENSAHGRRHWLCPVREDLQDLGYHSVPLTISAAQAGAPHERRRAYVLAHACSGRCGLEEEALRAGREGSELHAGWASEPGVRRVDDGVPDGVDRRRVLGNAVVPQVAEWIGRLILEMMR